MLEKVTSQRSSRVISKHLHNKSYWEELHMKRIFMGTRWSKNVDKNETVQWNEPHMAQDENWELEYMYILLCKRKEDAAFEEGETKESEEGRPVFSS